MIITLSWLKDHLSSSANLNKIIDKLTDIGLEVEGVKENQGELSNFKIAKVLKAEKHPNADKLKLCDVMKTSETPKAPFEPLIKAPSIKNSSSCVTTVVIEPVVH